jgi:hypothetical protein
MFCFTQSVEIRDPQRFNFSVDVEPAVAFRSVHTEDLEPELLHDEGVASEALPASRALLGFPVPDSQWSVEGVHDSCLYQRKGRSSSSTSGRSMRRTSRGTDPLLHPVFIKSGKVKLFSQFFLLQVK